MIRQSLARGRSTTCVKHFSTSARLNSYNDTISNLKIGTHTRVIFQGFTGKSRNLIGKHFANRYPRKTSKSCLGWIQAQRLTFVKATANAKESIAWGTKIVGGVTPGKNGEHLGLPVLPTVREV
jgi:succinyl-CoA synthetase alpha subunit